MADPKLASLPIKLTIKMFGAFEARLADAPLPPLRTRKGQSVLALLTLKYPKEVDREWLSGVLWPDSAPPQAAYNLRRCLSDLRQALGNASRLLESPTTLTLRLELLEADVDVICFDAAIARGDTASLMEAVTLYRGPLLEMYYEEWAVAERNAREQAYLTALEKLADHHAAASRFDAAARCLQQIVAQNPTRESAQRRLMEMLAAGGNYGAMVQAYRALRLYLHEELKTEPDAETTALYQRLRAAAKSSVSLTSSENSAQPQARGYIPLALTRFFGREQEIERLLGVLTTPSHRLITLVGMGGCGKTRLAQEVGMRLRQTTGKTIWFVSLVDIADPGFLYETIRDTLGLPRAGTDPFVQIAAELGCEPTLLILDNFEQLIADGVSLLRPLLEQAKTLTLLLTSRQPLHIAGEREFAVGPLPTPTSSDIPEHLSEFPSVQLFVDRVSARRMDFALTHDNTATVGTLCARLEGIPLAIEIAAGWAKVMTPRQMLTEVEKRFTFLVSNQADLPQRHRTLRSTLDVSFNLLSPDLMRFFAALTVFRGGWTREAAQEITGEPQALYRLWQLREHSLIVCDETLSEPEESMRFGMLETLREYGDEHLEEALQEQISRRHADYFAALAQEGALHLKGAEQAAWLQRMEAENDNFRSALTWSLDHAPETAYLLISKLYGFWKLRGYFKEGRLWTDRMLQRCPRGDSLRRAKLGTGAGGLAAAQGDYAEARVYYETALLIARLAGDQKTVSANLNNIGIVARTQHDFVTARACLEESLCIDEELGDLWGVAASLNNLGNLATDLGEHQTARALHERGLRIRRELGDQDSVAWSLGNLGNICAHLGDDVEAAALYEESLVILREMGDKKGTVIALVGLSGVASRKEDYVTMRRYVDELLTIILETQDKHIACHALILAADLQCAAGQIIRAARLMGAEEALREAIGVPIDPHNQAGYDGLLSWLRSSIEATAFASAWEEGRVMEWHDAIPFACETASDSANTNEHNNHANL